MMSNDKPLAATPEATADLCVSAGRMFSSALRVARASGIRGAQAVRVANDFTVRRLGLDWCQELGIADEVEELAPRSEAPTILGLITSNVGVFLEKLIAGALAPLSAAPGLTRDWYEAYCGWCVSSGEQPVSLKRFVSELQRDFRVPRHRKRFLDDAGNTKMAAVFLFGHRGPAQARETEWLSEQLRVSRRMFTAAGLRVH